MDTSAGTIELAGWIFAICIEASCGPHFLCATKEPLLFHRNIAENIGYGIGLHCRAEIEAAGKAAYVDDSLPTYHMATTHWRVGEGY